MLTGRKMKNTILIIQLSACTITCADLSSSDLLRIGHFLVLDFKSVDGSSSTPLTNHFFVKETGRVIPVKSDDILGVEKVDGLLKPGEYREVLIMNEVVGKGFLVRYAFIHDDQVVWRSADEALFSFNFRAELGSTGVTRFTDYSADACKSLMQGCIKGRIDMHERVAEDELVLYKKTIPSMWSLLMNQP
jgi:hypothetical protein